MQVIFWDPQGEGYGTNRSAAHQTDGRDDEEQGCAHEHCRAYSAEDDRCRGDAGNDPSYYPPLRLLINVVR
jgi:hypothetical protein